MIEPDSRPDLSHLADLPNCLRLAIEAIDAGALERDLETLADGEWTAHFIPDNYDGDWSILPLRAPVGASHPILRITSNPADKWEDTEFLAQVPAIKTVLDSLRCEIEAARLMRLAAGSTIKEHRDADLSADYGMARLHIPIATNKHVDFRVDGERIVMLPGECWYLNLSNRHSVANRGTTDRVHLVIDARVNDWLADLLLASAKFSTNAI